MRTRILLSSLTDLTRRSPLDCRAEGGLGGACRGLAVEGVGGGGGGGGALLTPPLPPTPFLQRSIFFHCVRGDFSLEAEISIAR